MTNTIHIQSDAGRITVIPNVFIDQYMAKAPGEYVKIYLYLLRCLGDPACAFSLSSMAQALDSSEGDVRRGLLYWKDQSLLELKGEGTQIRSITLKHTEETSHTPKTDKSTPSGDIPNCSLQEIKEFTRDPEISQLQFATEKYLSRPLTQKDLCYLYYWHHTLGFDADLITYLIEICISRKVTKMTQIHETALLWARHNVTSVRDVKALPKEKPKASDLYIKQVQDAMGLSSRSLNDKEQDLISDWQHDYDFSLDLVREACHRTIANTHQPSFGYADKVLKNWYSKGIKTMEGVSADDASFKGKFQQAPAKTTKFRNFTERKEDNRELERLLMTSDYLA